MAGDEHYSRRDGDGMDPREDEERGNTGRRQRVRSRSPGRGHGREGPRHRSPTGEKTGRGDRSGHGKRSRETGGQDPYERASKTRRSRSPGYEAPKSKKDYTESAAHASTTAKHHSRRKRRSPTPLGNSRQVVKLPFNSRTLSKPDLDAFRPLFAYYLSLQKQKHLGDMDEREVRGRWKSFVGKWNRGELAEGWYDPEMFVTASSEEVSGSLMVSSGAPGDVQGGQAGKIANEEVAEAEDGSDDDDDIGPVLPSASRGPKSGPLIPTLEDLSIRREMQSEDQLQRAEDLRASRKADRSLQKERLEDLAPRAEAGTRERMLEKRAAVNSKMKEFREKSPGLEVGEKELMGGGDSVEELKRMKLTEQRKKTEREVRREEVMRARKAEREERVKEYRDREEETMVVLRELARQRFG